MYAAIILNRFSAPEVTYEQNHPDRSINHSSPSGSLFRKRCRKRFCDQHYPLPFFYVPGILHALWVVLK